MKSTVLLATLLILFASVGCKDPYAAEKAAAKAAEEANKPETSDTGIFEKTTDEIGEFNPNAKQKISDGKMKQYNPLNPIGSLNAYGPAVEMVSDMQITQAINLFYAEKGHYPKTHQQFIDEIIKRNKITLPVLPGKKQYMYDVANHKLVVVTMEEEASGAGSK